MRWGHRNNVVWGRFEKARRRGSKHEGTDWLTPDAYDALSEAEKRTLAARRQRQRPRRTDWSGRKKSTGGNAWTGWALAGLLIGGATSWELPQQSLFGNSMAAASGANEVRAHFGFCHTGGGTNCVVDGDTFWIDGDKVRIAGIDAPETHPARCAREAELGEAATKRLRELLNSGAVTMTSIDRDRDRYGRLLRNVQVDGRDVGEALISAGVARQYGSGRRSWC